MPQFEAAAKIPTVTLPPPVSRKMLVSYLETAEWVGIIDPDPNANENVKDVTDISDDPHWTKRATKQAASALGDFIEECAIHKVSLDELTDTEIGHNFWLNRNGHGAGFWDLGLGKRGDELSKIAKRYGEENAIISDDGSIEFTGG